MTQNSLILAGAGLGYVGGQMFYAHRGLGKPSGKGLAIAALGAVVGYLYFKQQASQAQG